MKGYALSIDVTFGAFLSIFLIIVATSFMLSSYSSGIGDVWMKRVGSDAVALLDYNNTLDSLNENQIRSGIKHLLPPNLIMGVNITVFDENQLTLQEINIDYVTDINRLGGKYCFMTFKGSRAEGFAVADYWVAIG
jgi:hypothetical protein